MSKDSTSTYVVTNHHPSDAYMEATNYRGLRRWTTLAEAEAMCGVAQRAGFEARIVEVNE